MGAIGAERRIVDFVPLPESSPSTPTAGEPPRDAAPQVTAAGAVVR